MSRPTIIKGMAELAAGRLPARPESGRIRTLGGGRKRVEDADPHIKPVLARLVEASTAGDPMSYLLWTNKSTRTLTEELARQGYTGKAFADGGSCWDGRPIRRTGDFSSVPMLECSNGTRPRAWKVHVQALADRLGIAVTVCHYPPGTSKWNKVEHRLFSFISMNWRGRPLLSYEAVVNLIGNTTTKSGLRVKALLDTRDETGQKITNGEMRRLRITPHQFHGDWNYTLHPHQVTTNTAP